MVDEEVAAIILAIVVVAGILAATQAFTAGRVIEPFSEIAILGPNMKLADYPSTVLVNESFRLYLYLGNHEGHVMYYVVYVKLGDNSTFINATVPADAPVIATYEFIVPDGHNITYPIDLSINQPMTRARLIFELWILNEDYTLKYHERWLQLWLDVISPTYP